MVVMCENMFVNLKYLTCMDLLFFFGGGEGENGKEEG
jgi:hypothetical protein